MSPEQEAWAALVAELPDGWAASVTHVPSHEEWGATCSPGEAPFQPLIQSDTCRSETEALQALARKLRTGWS